MSNKSYFIMAVLGAGLALCASQAFAENIPGVLCQYQLTTSDVGIAKVKIVESVLEVEISLAQPATLYTVWIDFRNRARLASGASSFEALSDDYKPLVLEKGALERGVAPAFATTAGVTTGMGVDPNGTITSAEGEAELTSVLDYNLLIPRATPVVGAQLAQQGLNRVGGYWLRKYPVDPAVAASLQIVDPVTGLPNLERATAQGITIVRHPDFITHGHTPGVGDVDHFSAFKGDFPDTCKGSPPPPDP